MIDSRMVDRVCGGRAQWPTDRFERALYGRVIFAQLEKQFPDIWIRSLLAGFIRDRNLAEWCRDWSSLPQDLRTIEALKKKIRAERKRA